MYSLVETYGLNFPENALTLKCSKHIFRDVSKPKYLGGEKKRFYQLSAQSKEHVSHSRISPFVCH